MVGAQGRWSGHALVEKIFPSDGPVEKGIMFRAVLMAFFFLISYISTPVTVCADNKTWVGNSGDWSVDTNWDPAGVPVGRPDGDPYGPGDEAYISGSAGEGDIWDVILDTDYDSDHKLFVLSIGMYAGNAVLNHDGGHVLTIGNGGRLELGPGAGETGTYKLMSGTLSVSSEAFVGGDGSGLFYQSGGDFQMNGALYLGGYHAEYNMSGGTLTATDHITLDSPNLYSTFFNLTGTGQVDAGYMHVGRDGYGVFTQDGTGTSHTDGYLLIGANSGSQGTYNLVSGTHTVSGDLVLGNSATSTGTYFLLDGTLSTGNTFVGNDGIGFFVQGADSYANPTPGGTHNIGSDLFLGHLIDGTGNYVLVNGDLNVGGWAYIGDNGAGYFSQEGGNFTMINGGNLNLGQQPGSYGEYRLNGGNLTAGLTVVGNQGEGGFIQAGGTHHASSLWVAEGTASIGSYDLSAGDLMVAGNIELGRWGHGEFTQSGGRVVVGNDLSLGIAPGGSGYYDQSGGTVEITNGLRIGEAGFGRYALIADGDLKEGYALIGSGGQGEFIQIGGTHSVNDTLILGNASGSTGFYYLIGGTVSTGRTVVGVDGTGSFTQGEDFLGNPTPGSTHTITGDLIVGNWNTGTYTLVSGDLNVGGWAYIGDNGNGYIYHEGGNFNLTGGSSDLYLGYQSGGYGEYNLSGTGILNVGWLYVGGEFGTGLFNQDGGTVTVYNWDYNAGQMNVGTQAGSNGTYNLLSGILDASRVDLVVGNASGSNGKINQSGGVLTAFNEFVGSSGAGVFNQNGGTNTIFNELIVGRFEGSSGEYNMTGGELNAWREIIGDAGFSSPTYGVFDQSGSSTHVVNTDLIIGQDTQSVGVFTLRDAASLRVEGSMYVGDQGGTGGFDMHDTSTLEVFGSLVLGTNTESGGPIGPGSHGFFDQIDGTATVHGGLFLGYFDNTTGSYGMDGGSLAVHNSAFVGYSGRGDFYQYGGTNAIDWDLNLGWDSGSEGSYSLEGASTLTVGGAERIGLSGFGSFQQKDSSTHTVGAELVLANDPLSQGRYELRGGSLTVNNGYTFVGMNGLGFFIQTGGTHETLGLTLGQNAGSEGVYEFNMGAYGEPNDGVLHVTQHEHIGIGGKGTFTQNGGTHTIGEYLVLANEVGGIGLFNLNGGDLSSANAVIGMNGYGEFYQAGGSFVVADNLWIGSSLGSEGKYSISSGSLSAHFLPIGWEGKGTFVQTGGTVTVGGPVNIGQFLGSTGSYDLSGTGVLNTNDLGIGLSGTGTFTQGAGTEVHVAQGVVLGYDVSGTGVGTYDMNGGSLTAGHIIAGSIGAGTFNQNGGSVVTHALQIGTDSIHPSGGAYTMRGATTTLVIGDAGLNNGWFDVGGKSKGSFVQEDGSLTVNGGMNVGSWTGGNGTYELNGGTLTMLGSEVKLGRDEGAVGTFTQTGGAFTFAGAMYVGDRGQGTYIMQGGTLSGGGLALGEWAGSGSFYHSAGEVAVNDLMLARQNSPSASYGYYELSGTGQLTADNEYIGQKGDGRFRQTGGINQVSGTLTVRSHEEGTGLYEMEGGTLNAQHIVDNGTFSYTGGTLNFTRFSGNGTFVGAMTNTTTVAPGNSPGTLTIQGSYTQDATGTLEIELASLTSFDLLNVNGTADLAGTLDVFLYDGYTPVGGSWFDILTADAINGTFGTLSAPSGWIWSVAYLDLDHNLVNDTVRLSANAVPIPPTVWIFGSALLGIIGIRSRMRRHG